MFLADVKGDLAGLAASRDEGTGAPPPVIYWNILSEQGLSFRVAISDMGPMLLPQNLGPTEAQEGAPNITFRLAWENKFTFETVNDLRERLS